MRNDQLVTNMHLYFLCPLDNMLCYCCEKWLLYDCPAKQEKDSSFHESSFTGVGGGGRFALKWRLCPQYLV